MGKHCLEGIYSSDSFKLEKTKDLKINDPSLYLKKLEKTEQTKSKQAEEKLEATKIKAKINAKENNGRGDQ